MNELIKKIVRLKEIQIEPHVALKTHLKYEGTERLRLRVEKRVFCTNTSQKKVFMLITKSIHKKGITIINMQVHNNTASKSIKHY